MALRPPPQPTIDPANPNIWRWDDIGLTLIHNFITEAEEAALIAGFDAHKTNTPQPKQPPPPKKRISQHFGYQFDYTTFSASPDNHVSVPDYIASFLPRLPSGIPGQPLLRIPDQLTVQYYPPGSGIPPHVDTHSAFGEALYSLSYGSAVPMQFRLAGPNDARKLRLPKRSLAAATNGDSAQPSASPSPLPGSSPRPNPSGHCQAENGEGKEDDLPTWDLILPPRSLLIMTGPSRYGYVHGIRPRKTDLIPVSMLEQLRQVGAAGLPDVLEEEAPGSTTEENAEHGEEAGKEKLVVVPRRGRYSLTMRTVNFDTIGHCECAFPGMCDARVRQEQEEAERKEREQIHENSNP
jgi:alkylated DNA repair protein alkB family protein 8